MDKIIWAKTWADSYAFSIYWFACQAGGFGELGAPPSTKALGSSWAAGPERCRRMPKGLAG